MTNKFDQEIDALRDSQGAPAKSGLADLEKELTGSEYARHGLKMDCDQVGDELRVAVKGQVVGIWKNRGTELVLFRPGTDAPECVASNVSEAARMTARMIAAVAQA